MLTPQSLPIKSATVRFRLAGGAQPLILVPVEVNEHGPFDFFLDTGAGTSLLSLELASKLNVKVLGSKQGQSAGGAVSVSLAKVDSVAVGTARLPEVDVGIVDLKQIGAAVGAKIDGDLGYNFLKSFRISIDYEKCQLRLDDPRRLDVFNRESKSEMPLRLASPAKPLILVEVYANRKGPFQFAIDTGTFTTAITPQVAKQLRIKGSPIAADITAGAPVAVTAGVLDSFTVGGAKVDNMPVVIADFFATLSEAVGARLDGIVGYNYLRNYKVVIDYPNGRFTLV
ncbi:MAG: aspartyl protease family protein [Chthoniobacterales bacterium]